jgi:hypothetical protein
MTLNFVSAPYFKTINLDSMLDLKFLGLKKKK